MVGEALVAQLTGNKHLQLQRPRPLPGRPRSELLALVSNLQPELPTLAGQHHAAEFLPGDFSTIDDKERYASIFGSIPLNPALHGQAIRDLQSKAGLSGTLGRAR